ncbi:MAG: hypothetical protein NT069_03640 [Planctomycetota bacterium]|nr:hypothetical protein [Planctomycetota bacterium]
METDLSPARRRFTPITSTASTDPLPSATFTAAARSVIWAVAERGVVFKPQQDS